MLHWVDCKIADCPHQFSNKYLHTVHRKMHCLNSSTSVPALNKSIYMCVDIYVKLCSLFNANLSTYYNSI